MKAKVLVVGGGGREHAIVKALARSVKVEKIYCAPGNAGTAALAENIPIKDSDITALKDFALANGVDLTVVGPEGPLSLGIVDEFNCCGLRVFGPTAAAARIESSKDFAKTLMLKAGVPTASYRLFGDYDQALSYVKEGSFPVVLKYDGLAAGKGVVVAQTLQEADAALRDMLLDEAFGSGKVLVEEYLSGEEFSFMCLVDGETTVPLTLAKDHKRAFDGDRGPNTGGMGAYSPVPSISKEDEVFALENIMKPVAKALSDNGTPFSGVLYGGLMKTPSGIKVIEFNCRFGDPETEVVLPRLESDAYELFSAVADGRLASVESPSWSSESVVGFVLASDGYPGAYTKGKAIEGLNEALAAHGAEVCIMGAKEVAGQLLSTGGRVLMVYSSRPSAAAARDAALAAVREVAGEGFFYRSDIGASL